MNNIYCIIGNSGSGKTTIADALQREYNLSVLKSYTTRPKRKETDNDHIYIDEEEYFALQHKVATRKAEDGYYCATKEQVNNNDIYVIDFGGFFELKQKYDGYKSVKAIYIDVSPATSIERMRLRGDKAGSIINRIKRDTKDNSLKNIKTVDKVISGNEILAYVNVYDYISKCEQEV